MMPFGKKQACRTRCAVPNVNNGNPIPRFSPPDLLSTVNMIVERFEIDICVTIIITLFRAEYIYYFWKWNCIYYPIILVAMFYDFYHLRLNELNWILSYSLNRILESSFFVIRISFASKLGLCTLTIMER